MSASTVEFYPGTSTKISPRAEQQPAAIVDEDLFAKPRKDYTVNGQPFPCYSIGILAKALDRAVVTIRLWERQGLLPRSPFSSNKVQGDGKARLFTREQIEGIVRIAREEGVLDGKPISGTNFTVRVTKLFAEIEATYRRAR